MTVRFGVFYAILGLIALAGCENPLTLKNGVVEKNSDLAAVLDSPDARPSPQPSVQPSPSPSPSPSISPAPSLSPSPSPSPSKSPAPSPSPSKSPSPSPSPSSSPSPSPSVAMVTLDQMRAVLGSSRNNCFACHGNWMMLTEDGWKENGSLNPDWKKSRLLLRINRSAASLARVPNVSGYPANMPNTATQMADADFTTLANWVERVVTAPNPEPSAPAPVASYTPKPPSGSYFQPQANYTCSTNTNFPDVDPLKRLDRVSLIRTYSVIFADLGLDASSLVSQLSTQIAKIPADQGGGSSKNTDNAISTLHSQAWWDLAQRAAELITATGTISTTLPNCPLAAQAPVCVQNFLKKLATTAFSRAPTSTELTRYSNVYQSAGADASNMTTGLQMAIVSILMSPNFSFEVPEGALVTGQTRVYRNSSRWQKTLVYLRILNQRPPQSELNDVSAVDYTQTAQLSALLDRLLAQDYAVGQKAGTQVAIGNFDDWFPKANPLPVATDAAFIDIVKNTLGATGSDALNKQLQQDAQDSARRTFLNLAQQAQSLTAILGTSQVVAHTEHLRKIYGTPAVSTAMQTPGDGVKRGLVWVAGNHFTPGEHGVPGFFSIGKRLLQDLGCQNFVMPAQTIGGQMTGISGSPAPDHTRTHRDRYAAAVSSSACTGCHTNGLEVAFIGSGFGKLGNYNVMNGMPKEIIYDSNNTGKILNTFNANEKYWVSFMNGVNRAVDGPSDFVDAFVQSGMMQSCFNERVVASMTRRKITPGSSTGDACTATRVLNQVNNPNFPIQNAARAVVLDPSFIYYSK